MRRRQRRVPDTAQGSLGWDKTPEAEAAAGAPRKIRCGATAFRDATPWHLYVGDERLDHYLTARGMGWVVRLREELQAVDVGDLAANYTGTGRAPYHPRVLIGLIVYGTLKRKATLRELEELAVADVGAWWICGGAQPDHSTIGNFLVRHQRRRRSSPSSMRALARAAAPRRSARRGAWERCWRSRHRRTARSN